MYLLSRPDGGWVPLPQTLNPLIRSWERTTIQAAEGSSVQFAFSSPNGVLFQNLPFTVILRASVHFGIIDRTMSVNGCEPTCLRFDAEATPDLEGEEGPGRYAMKRRDGTWLPMPMAFDDMFQEWDRSTIADGGGPGVGSSFHSDYRCIMGQHFTVIIRATWDGTIHHREIILDGGEEGQLFSVNDEMYP